MPRIPENEMFGVDPPLEASGLDAVTLETPVLPVAAIV